MTDKEVIIHGVKVSKCGYLLELNNECECTIKGLGINDSILSWNCKDNPNCHFKQLARKTQECEELKAQIETYSRMLENPEFKVALTDVRTGERDIWKCKAERYEQALNEIYLIIDEIKEQYDIWEISELEQIKDIINKTKDGNNEQL